MIKRFLIVLLLSLLFVPAVNYAADWTKIGLMPHEYILYIDKENLSKQDDVLSVWIKYEAIDIKKFYNLTGMVELVEFRVTQKQKRTTYQVQYDDKNYPHEIEITDSRWKPIIPDSQSEFVLKTALEILSEK